MSRPRTLVTLITVALLSLGGCVAYPADGYYAAPTPVYTPPPTIYLGGTFGGYRPHHGHRHWGHHRGWR